MYRLRAAKYTAFALFQRFALNIFVKMYKYLPCIAKFCRSCSERIIGLRISRHKKYVICDNVELLPFWYTGTTCTLKLVWILQYGENDWLSETCWIKFWKHVAVGSLILFLLSVLLPLLPSPFWNYDYLVAQRSMIWGIHTQEFFSLIYITSPIACS